MRKIRLFSIIALIFLFSIFVVSCSGKKKSDNSNTVQTEQNNITYDVEFKNYNGDLLYEASVKEGEKASYSGDTPIRPDEADCYYTFEGWTPSIDEAVYKKTTYVAKFVRHDCTNYVITFKDDSGNTLYEGYVRENTMPSYPKGTPTKANDDNYSYTFKEWNPKLEKATENKIYEAEFDRHDLPYRVNIDLDGGSSVTLNKTEFKTDKLTSDMLPFDVNKSGFAFRGYELNGTKIFDEFGQEVSNISLSSDGTNTIKAIYDDQVKLTIKYTLYNPITNKLVEESISKPYYAEDVSETGYHVCNTEVDLYAEAADDYSFMGWYCNDIVLSNYTEYNYMMWEKDLTLEARFMINPYRLTVQTNKDALGNVKILKDDTTNYQSVDYNMYLAGESTTVVAYTKGETRFLGWYELIDDEEIFVSPNAIYSFVMPKKDYTLEARWELTTLTTKSNNTTYGTLSSGSVYDKKELEDGAKISLSCTAKTGYIFEGWYEGKTLVSENASFTYTMPKRAVTLIAVFKGVAITLDNQANVTTDFVSGIEYQTNKTVTINATNNTGKKLIWSINEIAQNYGDSFTFTTGEKDIVLKVQASDTYESIVYKRDGSYITFGRYPQTKLDDTDKISELNNNYATDLPTVNQTTKDGWKNYDYYAAGSKTSFMWYKDIDIDKDGTYDYRGVYFVYHRPANYSNYANATYSFMDDNGYNLKTVYWFSYEPILWAIKDSNAGKKMLLACLALDSQDFYPSNKTYTFSHNGASGYANNYALSNIRIWLNDTFYNTAFVGLEKQIIQTTTVDNSVSSTTNNSTNNYACSNTEDKIYLLSYREAFNGSLNGGVLGSADVYRQVGATDYAKCHGVSMSGSYCGWMLRSPGIDDYNGYVIRTVKFDGSSTYNTGYCYESCYGIRPVCWIES